MFYHFLSINWTLCSQNHNLQSFVGQVDTSGQVAFLSPSWTYALGALYQPGQPHFWDCTGIVTPASDVLLGGCPHIHVPQLGLCQVDCDASCLSLVQAMRPNHTAAQRAASVHMRISVPCLLKLPKIPKHCSSISATMCYQWSQLHYL